MRLAFALPALLTLSLSCFAQQTQLSTPPSLPPVVHHQANAAPAPATLPAAPGNVELSNDRHYVNSSGNVVHAPARAASTPAGASAVCGDGTYSFSQNHQGTCSHHGGVSRWFE